MVRRISGKPRPLILIAAVLVFSLFVFGALALGPRGSTTSQRPGQKIYGESGGYSIVSPRSSQAECIEYLGTEDHIENLLHAKADQLHALMATGSAFYQKSMDSGRRISVANNTKVMAITVSPDRGYSLVQILEGPLKGSVVYVDAPDLWLAGYSER